MSESRSQTPKTCRTGRASSRALSSRAFTISLGARNLRAPFDAAQEHLNAQNPADSSCGRTDQFSSLGQALGSVFSAVFASAAVRHSPGLRKIEGSPILKAFLKDKHKLIRARCQN